MYAWHCILDNVNKGVESESRASRISNKKFTILLTDPL